MCHFAARYEVTPGSARSLGRSPTLVRYATAPSEEDSHINSHEGMRPADTVLKVTFVVKPEAIGMIDENRERRRVR